MELPEKIAQFAHAHDMFPKPGLILAAVSGGADSVSLLAALCELSGKAGFEVAAVHYNHRLRGGESDGDADFVARLCAQRGIPLYSASGDVRRYASEHRLGIEDAARRLRYDFFQETAQKVRADRIATAHTADDNLETVLLNLTRGAGLRGLGGIPPQRGRIIRPMLTVTRREVMAFIASRSLTFAEDSTNSLDIYTRNLLRHRVIPVLAELNPRLLENVAVSAALLREDEAYLDGLARDYIAAAGLDSSLDIPSLTGLPRPVSGRVIRRMAGRQLSARHVSDVLALCASGAPSSRLSLPGVTLIREYDRLVFSRAPEPGAFAPVFLDAGETAEIPELGLSVSCRKVSNPSVCFVTAHEKINKSFNTFLFKYDSVCGNIVIRPRETGDKIALFGGSGSKSLKKLFIEKRIPVSRRSRIPVIADEAGVLAVYGIENGTRPAVDSRAACRPGELALEIEFKERSMRHDIEKVYYSEEMIQARVRELGAQLSADYADKKPLLVAVLKGSFIFLADLARAMDIPCEMEFITCSSYGNATETSGEVKLTKTIGTVIENRHVIIVEDILDTGLTLEFLKGYLYSLNPASLKICTFLDKPARRKTTVSADYVGFECADAFYVGYGLDYAGFYRNLPYIGSLKPEIYS